MQHQSEALDGVRTVCAIDPWSQGLGGSGLALRDFQRRQEGIGIRNMGRFVEIRLDGMRLTVFEGGGSGKEWKMSGRI